MAAPTAARRAARRSAGSRRWSLWVTSWSSHSVAGVAAATHSQDRTSCGPKAPVSSTPGQVPQLAGDAAEAPAADVLGEVLGVRPRRGRPAWRRRAARGSRTRRGARPARSTSAARRAPACWSTQCHDWAGSDEVEPAAGVVPRLERRHLDVEAVAAGDGGHPLVGLDPERPRTPGPRAAGRPCRCRTRRRARRPGRRRAGRRPARPGTLGRARS